MKLGNTPTGAVVNGVRLAIAIVGLGALVLAVAVAGVFAYDNVPNANARLYVAAGLFAGGFALLVLASSFKVQSHPFLIPNIVYQAMEDRKPTADIETIVRALEAHVGAAGFFNRIGFSGLSLGTIASAFLVLIFGLTSLKFGLISPAQFDVFLDLAKLLFGAFIGSFAKGGPVSAKPGRNQ